MSLRKWMRQLRKQTDAIRNITESVEHLKPDPGTRAMIEDVRRMQEVVKSVELLKLAPATLDAVESVNRMQELTKPVEILLAHAAQNPAQQYLEQREQEEARQQSIEQDPERKRRIKYGYLSGEQAIEESFKAKREKEATERQEDVARQQEGIEIQKAQLKSSNCQNILVVLGILVSIVIAFVVSDSLRSWLWSLFISD